MSARSRAPHLGNFDDRPWGISEIAITTGAAAQTARASTDPCVISSLIAEVTGQPRVHHAPRCRRCSW